MRNIRDIRQKNSESSQYAEFAQRSWDVLIVGGGLAGGLLALKLRERYPDLRFLLLEKAAHLGGEHTWSFHSADLDPEQVAWLKPFVKKSWPRVTVRFPDFERTLEGAYHSISSDRFDTLIRARLGQSVLVSCPVRDVEQDQVVLKDGTRLEASCVIDARGWLPVNETVPSAYQKFTGWDVRLTDHHGLKHPILMDATCPQSDGYRFFYLLPWDNRRLLVEDTRYSDSPELDAVADEQAIRGYIEAQGWRIEEVERVERGVLPIPLFRETLIRSPGVAEPPAIGARGGFVHPVTGYSLPRTLRSIDSLIEKVTSWKVAAITARLSALHERETRDDRFFLLLNRMLFRAPRPDRRWRVLRRFYGFEQGLIDRFYRGSLRAGDRFRILFGKAPGVPLFRAVFCTFESLTPSLLENLKQLPTSKTSGERKVSL
jgi:lycopene beta-cyclase